MEDLGAAFAVNMEQGGGLAIYKYNLAKVLGPPLYVLVEGSGRLYFL